MTLFLPNVFLVLYDYSSYISIRFTNLHYFSPIERPRYIHAQSQIWISCDPKSTQFLRLFFSIPVPPCLRGQGSPGKIFKPTQLKRSISKKNIINRWAFSLPPSYTYNVQLSTKKSEFASIQWIISKMMNVENWSIKNRISHIKKYAFLSHIIDTFLHSRDDFVHLEKCIYYTGHPVQGLSEQNNRSLLPKTKTPIECFISRQMGSGILLRYTLYQK